MVIENVDEEILQVIIKAFESNFVFMEFTFFNASNEDEQPSLLYMIGMQLRVKDKNETNVEANAFFH